MNVTEYVSRALSDKDFLVDAFRHVPAESLQVQVPESDKGDIGKVLTRYLWPLAQDMGYDFGEDELHEECERQAAALKGLAKVRLASRVVRSVTKVVREREQEREQPR